MKKLRIKIGGDALSDMKKIFEDPSKASPGTHTIYLKSAEELYETFSPKRRELLRYVISNKK